MNAAIQAIRVGVYIKFVIVIGISFGERVHTVVAANAVVEEYAAIATGAAADVLTHKIRRQAGVVYLFQIAAQVVDERKTKHGAVGTGDKKCLGGSAAGNHARGGIGR